jgi:hypothetical protein
MFLLVLRPQRIQKLDRLCRYLCGSRGRGESGYWPSESKQGTYNDRTPSHTLVDRSDRHMASTFRCP